MVRRLMLVIVIVGLAGSIGLAAVASETGPAEDVLEKEKGTFKRTLIHPEADFSRYEKLLPTTVVLQFKMESSAAAGDVTGSLTRGRSGSDEPPNRQDCDVFKRLVWEAVAAELGRSDEFEVVQDGSDGTLLVQVSLVDIDSNIPPEPPEPGGKVRPVSAQGVIVFDLIDAETGVLQARLGERRRSRRAAGADVPAEVGERWASIYSMAEAAATDLRSELERLRDGA